MWYFNSDGVISTFVGVRHGFVRVYPAECVYSPLLSRHCYAINRLTLNPLPYVYYNVINGILLIAALTINCLVYSTFF